MTDGKNILLPSRKADDTPKQEKAVKQKPERYDRKMVLSNVAWCKYLENSDETRAPAILHQRRIEFATRNATNALRKKDMVSYKKFKLQLKQYSDQMYNDPNLNINYAKEQYRQEIKKINETELPKYIEVISYL